MHGQQIHWQQIHLTATDILEVLLTGALAAHDQHRRPVQLKVLDVHGTALRRRACIRIGIRWIAMLPSGLTARP